MLKLCTTRVLAVREWFYMVSKQKKLKNVPPHHHQLHQPPLLLLVPIFLISTHAFRVECFRAFYQSFSGKFWIYFSNWVGCKNAEKDLRKLKSGFSHFQQKLRGYRDQQQHRITGWLQRQRTCNHNLVKNQTACVAFNTSQCIIIILPSDFLDFLEF